MERYEWEKLVKHKNEFKIACLRQKEYNSPKRWIDKYSANKKWHRLIEDILKWSKSREK
jgi:hypothetical protein